MRFGALGIQDGMNVGVWDRWATDDKCDCVREDGILGCGYSGSSLLLQFFVFSFVGWSWEVLLHVVMDHAFVNRGVMMGPWLPIYGSGGVLILLVLNRLRRRPGMLFGAIMLVCGIVEYFTAVFLETFLHASWWDYSDMMFQIQGRVCLAGLLLFGAGGCFIVYVAAPWLDGKIEAMPVWVRRTICTLLAGVFVMDMLYSAIYPNMGAGITF